MIGYLPHFNDTWLQARLPDDVPASADRRPRRMTAVSSSAAGQSLAVTSKPKCTALLQARLDSTSRRRA